MNNATPPARYDVFWLLIMIRRLRGKKKAEHRDDEGKHKQHDQEKEHKYGLLAILQEKICS
jgi:hypothetical protein